MADGTLLEFKADLQTFADMVGVTLVLATRKVALLIHEGVVEMTPVDTGRARGSWGISLDAPGDYVLPEGEYGIGGGGEWAQQRNVQQLKEDNPYREVWIYNNLEYIEALEMGHSQQAPLGMAAVTLAEVAASVDAIIEEEAKRTLPK